MITMDLENDLSERVRHDYPEYPVYIRHGLLSYYPNHAAPSHWHDDVEFIAVQSGQMDYNVNGQILTLQQGDGLFVNARQMHYGFSAAQQECEFLCILFHPSALRLSPILERSFITPITENRSLPFMILTPDTGWKSDILQCIRVLYEKKGRPSAILHIQSLFNRIWADLYENMPQKEEAVTPQNGHQLSLMKEMLGYIHQHYSERVTLADIAHAGHICQSKCCALFRQYLSQTPISYLTSYRLDRSAELLRYSNMTITEISYASGFSNASYYAETFRRWMGYSPKAYRKRMQDLP